ncbi:hypothetical protein, partial [Microcoleus sp. herbarium2]|uniref:hypothetical protein n=1 Tax=Microcoleus sp. herbarium2 TaxID=3055433 RepID=UPI002FD3FDAE
TKRVWALFGLDFCLSPTKELANKIIPQEITLGLQEFIEKAESGQILKPHLSTHSDKPDYKASCFTTGEYFTSI